MLEPDDPHAAETATLAGNLRVLLGRISRRLRTASNTNDLTWSQKMVLSHLERKGPATVSTLARIEGVRPQSMGATVAMLEAAGLVRGAPDPTDGRQTLLSLSPACLDMLAAARAAREDWLLRALQSKLTAEEQAELARAIPLIARLVD